MTVLVLVPVPVEDGETCADCGRAATWAGDLGHEDGEPFVVHWCEDHRPTS